MKRLALLFTFTISAIICSAQAKVWERLELDSADFVKTYGTASEYEMQDNFRVASGKDFGYRVLLVGMKVYWINQLTTFMEKGGYTQTDMRKDGDRLKLYYTSRNNIGKSPSKFCVAAKVTKDGRISDVTISGNADPLLQMFTGYWGTSAITLNEVKSKGILQSSFLSDKITFKWNGGNPVIEVSKI